MVVGLDCCLLVGVLDDRGKHLEAEGEEALVLGLVDALDAEAEQAFCVGVLEIDAERDGVRAGDREHLIATGFR
jgi:hypothetical protein